jgi:hypothetical protein
MRKDEIDLNELMPSAAILTGVDEMLQEQWPSSCRVHHCFYLPLFEAL